MNNQQIQAYRRLSKARNAHVQALGNPITPINQHPTYIATLPHSDVIERLIDAEWDWDAAVMTDEEWQRILDDEK